ncbi:hypothetical protein E2C01_088244 [Portunus trituberculatus]|uniref:Uncharacterized protein n=1 Tax=Portunus trituberculatus TaxID=210409 RepID=A0A5B7JA82_PORTR|nr:hypothetical protein [Portunus trituberculatus]
MYFQRCSFFNYFFSYSYCKYHLLPLSLQCSQVITDLELLFSCLICQINASVYALESAAVVAVKGAEMNLWHTHNNAIKSPVLHLTLLHAETMTLDVLKNTTN